MICVVIKGPSYEEALKQMQKTQPYADCFEFRLDMFRDLYIEKIRDLRTYFRLPVIFTLRSPNQGGYFTGPLKDRLNLIRHLAKLEPDYLDIEWDVSSDFINEIKAINPKIKIILSYHDFFQTPIDFNQIYTQIKSRKADICKLAFMALNTIDCLRLLDWAGSVKEPLIAISMGQYGIVSRIVGPVIGCPFTYAIAEQGLETAPNQLSARVLHEQYRYRQLGFCSSLYGLIGSPVSTSVSDVTHNAFFSEMNFNAVYVKLEILMKELRSFLAIAKKLPFKGISVTMPLKEVILPFLDEIDIHAKEIGAVNTLVFQEGKIKGYNTDGVGALNAIEKQVEVKGKKVVILGAGGAAKAIAFESYHRGAHLIIINRDKAKAEKLAGLYNGKALLLDQMKSSFNENYDILINTVPVDLSLPSNCILSTSLIMDIRTQPKITELLRQAMEKKTRIVYGIEMFIEQALGQFSLWFQ